MVDAASDHGNPLGPNTLQDQHGAVQKKTTWQRQLWWPCKSDDIVCPYGIVEIYDAEPGGVDFYFKVRLATADASQYGGNEAYQLCPGEFGWIKLITPYEPVVVRSKGTIAFLQTLGIVGDYMVPGTVPHQLLYAECQPEVDSGRIGVLANQGGGTTTPGPPVYGTTTPHDTYKCAGTCIWSWDAVNLVWTLTTNNCNTTTTTSTTSTTTTTGGTTTTTTTPSGCVPCLNTTTSTTTTSTTSTTTTPGCQCLKPNFCGDGTCSSAQTDCVPSAAGVPPQPYCGGTSSTTTCGTTTGGGTGCSGCNWMWDGVSWQPHGALDCNAQQGCYMCNQPDTPGANPSCDP